jgi:hypothetical protein
VIVAAGLAIWDNLSHLALADLALPAVFARSRRLSPAAAPRGIKRCSMEIVVNSLIAQMREYVAYTSVGASTVRGQRKPGLVSRLRRLLAAIDLEQFAQVPKEEFKELLDEETSAIQRRLPPKNRHWGIARKVLNIFLRGALYNTYLREAYNLDHLEDVLEIPLDSLSAAKMRQRSSKGALPRWRGVKYLTPEDSRRYQARASELATEWGMARVHLDIYFFVDRGEANIESV